MSKIGEIPYEDITNAQETLSRLTIEYWVNYNFLTFKWWLLVGLSTIPLIVWIILLDKKRARQIIMFGLLVSLTAGIMDTIGFTMGLWGYPVKLIPINPPYFPVDFVYLPVMYMLIYQYFPAWKSFIIMNVLVACFYSFVGEPIFEWLDMYITYDWKYLISLPIYIAMAIFFKWFVQFFVKVSDPAANPDQSAHSGNRRIWLLPLLTISPGVLFWTIKRLKRKGKKKRKSQHNTYK